MRIPSKQFINQSNDMARLSQRTPLYIKNSIIFTIVIVWTVLKLSQCSFRATIKLIMLSDNALKTLISTLEHNICRSNNPVWSNHWMSNILYKQLTITSYCPSHIGCSICRDTYFFFFFLNWCDVFILYTTISQTFVLQYFNTVN